MSENIENNTEHLTKEKTEQETEETEDMRVKYRGKECRRIAWLGSLMLKVGDPVEVVIRGRVDSVFRGKFWCYNSEFNWLWIKTEDNDLIVKVRDIKFLRKLRG